MKINQLVTRGNASLETTERQSKLGEFINQFILSNMFNVFKVIYVKDSGTREKWEEIISSHVGGRREMLFLRYDIETIVYVYSETEKEYNSRKYTIHNVCGRDIVETCFNEIREVEMCDMLAIKITSCIEGEPYDCCYLFTRS